MLLYKKLLLMTFDTTLVLNQALTFIVAIQVMEGF